MAQELELRSAAYKEARVTLSGTVSKGEFATINNLNGFYLEDGVSGDVVTFVYQGEKVKAAKTAALAIAVGEKVYFNTTTNLITKTGTDVLVGTCVYPALAADSYVLIDFDGREAFLKA